jgi:hypothetical protein
MLTVLAQSDFDWVGFFKTAAVVVVFVAILAVVIRALGARPSAMRKGAAMPLDELKPLDDDPSNKHTT